MINYRPQDCRYFCKPKYRAITKQHVYFFIFYIQLFLSVRLSFSAVRVSFSVYDLFLPLPPPKKKKNRRVRKEKKTSDKQTKQQQEQNLHLPFSPQADTCVREPNKKMLQK